MNYDAAELYGYLACLLVKFKLHCVSMLTLENRSIHILDIIVDSLNSEGGDDS
jgi:hypothetical protein